MHGVSFGQTTNNVEEYNTVIELLSNAISFGIRRFIIRLDSELVVLRLNRVYTIKNQLVLRLFLRVRLLERKFDYIEYQHISRNLNTLADALANCVLNRHFNTNKVNKNKIQSMLNKILKERK